MWIQEKEVQQKPAHSTKSCTSWRISTDSPDFPYNFRPSTRWWFKFEPNWKKRASQMGSSSPKLWVNIESIWNHHLVNGWLSSRIPIPVIDEWCVLSSDYFKSRMLQQHVADLARSTFGQVQGRGGHWNGKKTQQLELELVTFLVPSWVTVAYIGTILFSQKRPFGRDPTTGSLVGQTIETSNSMTLQLLHFYSQTA